MLPLIPVSGITNDISGEGLRLPTFLSRSISPELSLNL